MFSVLYHYQDYYRTWLYIWVIRLVSYKKQELLTIREHPSSPSVFWWGPCCSSFYFFLCCPIMCSVLWCPLRFPHKTMFGSSWYPVVCRSAYVLLTLFVFVFVVLNTYRGVFLFCFLRLVYRMLPVSLDCPFLITPSVFSKIYSL